ncbi:MAG: N-succinylarginine dihydrolase [Phycisphaerae bacterium]|nr:N-succinylarginine dihydrolase [Phycisphaerae bacterium]
MPELNLDGIVGSTHNYAGLSLGNVASTSNQGSVSRPREAARQGLAKMAALARLGLAQGFLPPQERPHLPTLRASGFAGTDAQVVERAAAEAPHLLAQASSASCMWTANAATVTPSAECSDGRVHMTVANLRAMPHRKIEPPQTLRTLRAVFPNEARFAVHEALAPDGEFGDEGAANHTRLTSTTANGGETSGVHLFVYGARADGTGPRPTRYPARQTLEACLAIAKRHGLSHDRCVFAQQHPAAIDQGVFHNDVIAVGNGHVLLMHEHALVDQHRVLDELQRLIGPHFQARVVPSTDVTVEDAVRTYLFNSQLVTLPDRSMALILPSEAQDHAGVRRTVDALVGDSSCPVNSALYLDVRESMRNGGGPACLRLRVPLTPRELAAVAPGCLYSPTQHAALEAWIDRHYRPTLAPHELADPKLLQENRDGLDELTKLLGLGSIYEFQQR